MNVKSIRTVENLKGKKVLLRSTLNVPLKDGEIISDFRLCKSLETINFLIGKGAKVILVGHLGREGSTSLSIVYEQLKKYIKLSFTQELLGDKTKTSINTMKDGEVVLLENVRSHSGETTNDEDFAKELALLADIYVNDAFSTSHRMHASIVGVPKYLPSFAGFLFMSEMEKLSLAINPPSPALCVLGGAKFATKIPLIAKLLGSYDIIFVAGALANAFLKAKGFNIGKSFVSEDSIDVQDVKALFENKKVRIPFDVIVKNEEGVFVKNSDEVLDDDKIVDAGPKTIAQLGSTVGNFNFILWNGPLGTYEKGFVDQTESFARYMAQSSAETLIGGGDTIASIEHLGLEDQFSFISTGGGAMLEFLLNGTLVGIEALKNGIR